VVRGDRAGGAAIGYLYARVFHTAVALTRRLPGGRCSSLQWADSRSGCWIVDPPDLEQRLRLGTAGSDRTSLMGIPLWIVIVLPIAKIVATSLSIAPADPGGFSVPESSSALS